MCVCEGGRGELTIFCTVHGFENVAYTMREKEEIEEALGQDKVDTTFKREGERESRR